MRKVTYRLAWTILDGLSAVTCRLARAAFHLRRRVQRARVRLLGRRRRGRRREVRF